MAIRPLPEKVYFYPPVPDDSGTWWSRYAAELAELSPTVKAAIEADSRYIVERGILGGGDPSAETWPVNRSRTGLVMGSVQSGKTASMLGVSALAMDRGVDVVIVLAGTRLSLWRQTYGRLVEQLDAGPEGPAKRTRRLLCPAAAGALSEGNHSLSTTYGLMPAAVKQRLLQHRPVIIVAMKQTHHLRALSASLRRNVFGAIKKLDRPVHMMVLDDEADDGSILDAVVESSQDPIYGNLKQIPRAVANLWDPPQGAPTNLFSTYVAYTGTPQANLLQEDHNPLAPRDFIVSLRTPFDIGHPIDTSNVSNLAVARSGTYPEPAGIRSYYTGGEVFYRRAQRAGLCVQTTTSTERDLGEAVRAFLVAGAIRLHRSARMGPASASSTQFASEEAVLSGVAEPNSMLYHPSAAISDHFEAAEDVLLWAGVSDRATARKLLDSGNARLPDALAASLRADSTPWARWLDTFQASSKELESEFDVLPPKTFPNWQTLEDLLVNEIIPGTRVAVVNSDPAADDRPEYSPTEDLNTGRWNAARDLSTIFVSGNVMARGLTLEGMTTALFQRGSTSPKADTQMQMQRWFGYRGPYIELCRVFASQDQFRLFRAYHDVDEALRTAISERMMGGAPEPTVLQGLDFAATAKIANFGNQPLAPGAQPFVTVVNDGMQPDPNTDVVATLFDGPSTDLTVGNILRGRVLDRPLDLAEAAQLLDSLVYDQYRPSVKSAQGVLWKRIEARVNAIESLADEELYRPPLKSGQGTPSRRACPYTIAAYLRLWSASLTRPVPGLFITGHPGDLWSYSNLARKAAEQPRFWVGIRYGNGAPVTVGSLARLPFDIRATAKNVRGGELTTTWGANDPTAASGQYRGDSFFDYYHRKATVPIDNTESAWRPAGSDGQILFFINQNQGQINPAVAVGVCIPAGGPEQFSAIRAGTANVPRS